MKKYSGKTLLVLGSNVGSTDIVTYARKNGACVIVADYFPTEKSSAKKIADKQLLISTANLEKLSEVIEKYHVDGVLAGISEFNILQALALSEKFNLPFYCTKKQWDTIENKNDFRLLCEKYKVPCPRKYYSGTKLRESDWMNIKFPAVIKPVDGCASAGVHICKDEKEMRFYEPDALAASGCGKVIVEELAEGNEFTAHYTIANGKATLSCVDNRYPVAVHEGNVTTIPIARIYPSLFLEEYMEMVNPYMLDLCEGIGLQNAILFVQGLYDENQKKFSVFEAGLRSAGEAPYRFLSKINGVNSMELLVDHALSGQSDFDAKLEDPTIHGKCCGVVSFVSKGGTVGCISGLEEAVANTPSVIEYESRYPEGSTTPEGDTLRQLMIRFVMVCDSRQQMERDIAYLNERIEVLNDHGENMVIKMEPKRVYGAI